MSWISQHFEESPFYTVSSFGDLPCEAVGEEVQRLSVLNNLPNLLKGSEAALCMQRVVPKIMLALDKASTEFHMATASTFYTILEKKLVHPRTYAQTFLQSMITCIDNRDPAVASVWLDMLLEVIELLPSEIIRSDILPVAISKGQISQTVPSRLTSCKILGKSSTRLESFLLKKEVLPVILSLCQDVNYEVRGGICTQLMYVAKVLDPDSSKAVLLPSLVELASDEEVIVRIAAVDTIVEILPHLQADSLKHTIVPLVKKLCNQAMNAEDDVLCTISFQIGKLCLGLESYLSLAEKQWLLGFYQQLARLGVPNMNKDVRKNFNLIPDLAADTVSDRFILCRQNCAYNFPAVAVFTTRLGEAFYDRLYSTFCELASDPYFMVRRTIASGIHEVTAVLGAACGMIKNELVKLLRDDVEEVLQGLIPNLSKAMEQLAKNGHLGPDNMDAQSVEIGRALLKCEGEISQTHNWRLHSLLMTQFECLPLCLPSEFLHNHFIPILFVRIHTARAVPCRVAAARTLLVFLRYNSKHPQRNEMRARIITEFCRGHSCFNRITYAKLCGSAMDIFSRRYFKDHFYLQLLELAEDSVANVRLQFVGYLPRLKSMLRLPSDKKLLQTLETTVRKLLGSEKDRDVKAVLNRAILTLDKIEVPVENVGNLQLSKDDIEDQRKLEEENRLVALKFDSSRRKTESAVSSAPPPAPKVPPPIGGIKRAYTGRGVQAKTNLSKYPGAISARPPRVAAVSSAPITRPPSIASLEDEFYVDAGIRIPQQLAASGELPTFTSRIPNLREILFKNRNVPSASSSVSNSSISSSSNSNIGSSSGSICISSSSTKNASNGSGSVCESTASGDIAVSSHPNTSLTICSEVNQEPLTPSSESSDLKVRYRQNGYGASGDAKTGVKSSSTSVQSSSSGQKTLVVGGTKRQGSEIYNFGKSEQHYTSNKRKDSYIEQKNKDVTVIVNRRHSYMDGEKLVGGNGKTEHSISRKGPVTGNRRHSYIERVEDTEKYSKSISSSRKFSGCAINVRSTLADSSVDMGNSKVKNEVTLRKSSIPNRYCSVEGRNIDMSKKRRSFIYTSPTQSSCRLDQNRDLGTVRDSILRERMISQIVKHPQSLSVENKRRHSSLERDDLEKLKSPLGRKAYNTSSAGQPRSLRSSLECINSSNEIVQPSESPRISSQVNVNSDRPDINKSLYRNNLKSPDDLLAYPSSDENLDTVLKKRNRLSLSKIPRGPTSCHSSPGGSRASSPTGTVNSEQNIRIRQRTAPNSRSSSPTESSGYSGNLKRSQRLSLGSLNSYMSNLKLTESASRLPIRKPY